MIDFINFLLTKKVGIFVALILALLLSITFNTFKKNEYYYDVGIYVDSIVIHYDDERTVKKEEVFSYGSIFNTRAFYIEHNRTRLQKTYPLIIRLDTDTFRVVDNKYDDTYSHAKELLEKIYRESILNIKSFNETVEIFKTQAQKEQFNEILKSNINTSKIFSYTPSPVIKTGIVGIKAYLLFFVLILGIYISFIFLEFAKRESN